MKGLQLAVAAGCFLMFAVNSAAAGDQAIIVHQEARVISETIYLGDIATIQGGLQFIRDAEKIVIGRAPLPGQQRKITAHQIITRLKQHDINVKAVQYVCPREITVVSECVEFTESDLAAIFCAHVRTRMPWSSENTVIKEFRCKPVLLPQGEITHSCSVLEGEDFLGKVSGDISFYVDGRFTKKIRISAHISVLAPVAVSLRTIGRHEIVEQDAVRLEKRDLTGLSHDTIRDIREILGKRARGGVNPGAVLEKGMFEKAPIVRRGEQVTVYLETDSFRITMPGEALDDGGEGDLIRVSNAMSQKKIYGFVRDSSSVEVQF